jgi:nitrogenase subunit NifH
MAEFETENSLVFLQGNSDLAKALSGLARVKEQNEAQINAIRQFIKDVKIVIPAASFAVETKARATKLLKVIQEGAPDSRFTDAYMAARMADMIIESSTRLAELAMIMEEALAKFELEEPE